MFNAFQQTGLKFLLAGVLGSWLPAIHAMAACPAPIVSGAQAEVIKKHLQNESPQNPEKYGRLVSELIRKGVISPLSATPPSGPSPLIVDIKWMDYPIQDPTRIEIDANGDGIASDSVR
jgi:hypothetical protein